MKKINLLIVLIVILLTSCNNNEEWPTLGGNNQRTSDANTTGPLKISNIKWKFNAVENGQFEGDNFFKGVIMTPIVSNGMVLFGSNDSCFYAVDLETGVKKWVFKTNSFFRSTSAAANNDCVFFTNHNGTAYALDINTGNEIWTFSIEGVRNGTDSSPIIKDSIVVFKLEDCIFALNLYTGIEEWSTDELFGLSCCSNSIASYEDLIFYSPNRLNDYFVCCNIKTGKEKWRYKMDDCSANSPAISNGIVFFVCGENLYAIDINTGQEKWSFNSGRFGNKIISNKVVYVSGNKFIYALDINTGQEKWKVSVSQYIQGMAISDELLYATFGEGKLQAFNINTGNIAWEFKTNDIITSGPILVNGCVLFSSKDGYVWALE